MNLWKPWYVYRPQQLFLRLVRAVSRRNTGLQTVILPWGVPLRVDPDQLIGKSIWRTGVFELLTSEILFRLIDPGETVVDIGANIGYMSSILACAAGPRGRVHAFEPHPAVFEQLQDNIRLFQQHRKLAGIEVHSLAVSDNEGTADLYLPESFGDNDGAASMSAEQAGTRPAVQVRTVRLDVQFREEKIGLLKIDVEGFEETVLRGATELLKSHRIRDIVYEDHLGPDSPPSKLLKENGYQLYRLNGRGKGLQIQPAAEAPTGPHWESPSYLATVAPERAKMRCDGLSWRALRAG